MAKQGGASTAEARKMVERVREVCDRLREDRLRWFELRTARPPAPETNLDEEAEELTVAHEELVSHLEHVEEMRRWLFGPNAETANETRAEDPTVDLLERLVALQKEITADSSSLDDVMRTICERSVSLAHADGAAVEMVEGDELVMRVAAGSLAPFVGLHLPKRGNLSGLALVSRRSLTCDDIDIDFRVDRDTCRRIGARSLVVVPLEHAGRAVGVLKITSRRRKVFTPTSCEVVRILAGFVEAAMTRAAADARAEETRVELERLAQLETFREELTALVVHDLRSPLAAIDANLDYLITQMPGHDANEAAAAVNAMRATNRLDLLVTTMLETTKLESGRLPLTRSDVDLLVMLEAVRAERAPTTGAHGIQLLHLATTNPVHATVDGPLLRRVIDNVVDNALRFTPDGGKIALSAIEEQDAVVIRIANTGMAIPEEDRTRIFEKFARGDSARRASLGFGLYFARLAIEAHGGRIKVESTDEWPTVFVLELPKT